MITLNDLIQVHDDTLEPYVCSSLIDFFESNSDKHEMISNGGYPNFTQLNFTEYHKLDEQVTQLHNYVVKKIFDYRNKYYEFVDKRVFPESHALEQIRIKKYLNNGEDYFKTHVDVTDYDSSRRYLAYIWYLNDVEEGGETKFYGLTDKPKTGKLVLFPPLWMFPHSGLPPVSGIKYIMSAYLHYK